MEEVADLVTDAEIPLDYSKDGIFNPTQVLRSGKQVFSELRATTIEKGEFEVRWSGRADRDVPDHCRSCTSSFA